MAGLLRGLRDLIFGQDKSYLATVGIDLGTTHSGFAFSFNNSKDEGTIFMNRKWKNEVGQLTSKIPSCLLLNPDLSFDSFGYRAVERYAYLKDVFTTWTEFLFFEQLKISPAEGEILNSDTILETCSGQAVRAITVFAHCIKFLKNEAIDFIQQKSGGEDCDVEDILWVITVPVTWNSTAKQFMREAAYEAGIGSHDNPGQVIIALDAEAAALYYTNTRRCEAQTDILALEKPNEQCVIVDLGGGCLKATAFGKSSEDTVHMSYSKSISLRDKVRVNCQFRDLLDLLFGAQTMCDYRKLFASDWMKIMQDFEAKKCTFHTQEVKIRLTGSLVSWVNDFLSPSMKRFAEGAVRIADDEYLCLCPRVMRSLFQPLLEAIKDHLQETVLNKPRFSKQTAVCLVGGLSESSLVRESVRNAFCGRNSVVTTTEASMAVANGGVVLGKRAAAENRWVVNSTYGADCSRRFVKGVHPEENKFSLASGEERCKDLFNCFVGKDEIVNLRQRIAITYRPREASETKIIYSFYVADVHKVLLVTEPGVKKIGHLVLHSPDTLKGLDRDIEVSLHFVGADVIASAWDVTSGNIVQTTLDSPQLHVNCI